MKTIVLTLFSFSLGILVTVYYFQNNTEQYELAYNLGWKDALNVEKPSEKLEYVCAALWFKGQEHGNRIDH